MPPKKKFDVFLSHNSRDKSWVVGLKSALEALDIKVWLDKDEVRPGDLFAKALERGIQESKAVALIISPEAMTSGWVEAEYYRALSLAANNQLQLIPVLYKKAQLPGFLSDRNWVDFSDAELYTESVQGLVWGITGEKVKLDKREHKPVRKSARKLTGTSREITQLVKQIKNPFVRVLERRLRMENAHWIQAGFSVPAGEFNFTSVYYQNQIEVFRSMQAKTREISNNITGRKVNLLQDAFLDEIDKTVDQVIMHIHQVNDLLSVSGKEFELSVVMRQAGKVIQKDVQKVKKLARYAPMRLISNPREYDRVSESLSTEIAKLAISIEEYQRHLTTIVKQANLEKIYSY